MKLLELANEEQLKNIKYSQEYFKKHPKAVTSYYWVYIPADPDFPTAFGKGREACVAVHSKFENGYEMASERIPQFDEVYETRGRAL